MMPVARVLLLLGFAGLGVGLLFTLRSDSDDSLSLSPDLPESAAEPPPVLREEPAQRLNPQGRVQQLLACQAMARVASGGTRRKPSDPSVHRLGVCRVSLGFLDVEKAERLHDVN